MSELNNLLEGNTEYISNVCNQLTNTFTEVCNQMEEQKQQFREQLKSIEEKMNTQITGLLEILMEKEKEIKNLQDELKEHKFNESNYTKVSFIKQQDKLISEQNAKIDILERQLSIANEKLEQSKSNNVEDFNNKSIQEEEIASTPILENNAEVQIDTPISNNEKSSLVPEKKKRKPRKKKEDKPKPASTASPKKRGRKKKVIEEPVEEEQPVQPVEEPVEEEQPVQPVEEEQPVQLVEEDESEEPVVEEDEPDLDDMDVVEFNDMEYYMSTKSNYVYEYANDEGDIGNRVGYFKNNKIVFY